MLYKSKEDCCACEACANICPNDAISMVEDQFGFLYPLINHEICVDCKLCKKVCAYQNHIKNDVSIGFYAAMAKDDEIILNSSSGGVFFAIARSILKNKGIVYGCTMHHSNNGLSVKHIRIDDMDQLYRLQGSKYVQSSIGNIYKLVKKDLIEKKCVLFSGTPCQVEGLKGYLGKTNYGNLFLVDLICHGVPSLSLFQDYIKHLEKKIAGKIIDYKFRHKTFGWGLSVKIIFITKKKKVKTKYISAMRSSYYQLFLNEDILRDSCYSCKYASPNRSGDITIGDYWGIETEHPEYLKDNGGMFDKVKGISCLLCNSEKGKSLIIKHGEDLLLAESSFEKIARSNSNLIRPTKTSMNRQSVLDEYYKSGYDALDKRHNKNIGKRRVIYHIWENMPLKIRFIIKKIIKRKR
jgi:coenzyme F420-reducing hydrogenase beta subunit